MSDEERAGKLRDIDFKVGLHGYKDPGEASGGKMHKDMNVMRIEGLLSKVAMHHKDEIADTAVAILQSTENGRHNPEAKQKDVVRMFVAPMMRGHDAALIDKAVNAIHNTAQMHVQEKFAFELSGKSPTTPQQTSTAPVKPGGMKR